MLSPVLIEYPLPNLGSRLVVGRDLRIPMQHTTPKSPIMNGIIPKITGAPNCMAVNPIPKAIVTQMKKKQAIAAFAALLYESELNLPPGLDQDYCMVTNMICAGFNPVMASIIRLTQVQP